MALYRRVRADSPIGRNGPLRTHHHSNPRACPAWTTRPSGPPGKEIPPFDVYTDVKTLWFLANAHPLSHPGTQLRRPGGNLGLRAPPTSTTAACTLGTLTVSPVVRTQRLRTRARSCFGGPDPARPDPVASVPSPFLEGDLFRFRSGSYLGERSNRTYRYRVRTQRTGMIRIPLVVWHVCQRGAFVHVLRSVR